MGREWKPGDVAVDSDGRRWARGRQGWWWGARRGDPGCGLRRDDQVGDLRPLVVIDPEDREAVERLRDAFNEAAEASDPDYYARAEEYESDEEEMGIWLAALREFVNPAPPKPPEPTGLGAVVEDAEGRIWVRRSLVPGDLPWDLARDREASGFGWSQIAAVRVLSEGVQP